jgi:hypothetical protein
LGKNKREGEKKKRFNPEADGGERQEKGQPELGLM